MKRIIFVADDFGLTPGVNQAIIELHQQGIIRHTAFLANSNFFDESVQLLKEHPTLEVSCHLTLTFGKPLSSHVSTLVTKEGKFKPLSAWKAKAFFDQEQIEQEFEAQIQKILATGIPLAALNCHHNLQLDSDVAKVLLKLAQKYHLPIRNVNNSISKKDCQDVLAIYGNASLYKECATLEELNKIIDCDLANQEVIDIQTHPGYVDQELEKITSYVEWRQKELVFLRSKAFKNLLNKHNIKISNYQEAIKQA